MAITEFTNHPVDDPAKKLMRKTLRDANGLCLFAALFFIAVAWDRFLKDSPNALFMPSTQTVVRGFIR